MQMEISPIQEEELEILLNDLFNLYGYDFTEYSKASMQRRVQRLFLVDKFPSFAEFRHRLHNDPQYFRRFVEEITVNVTEINPLVIEKARKGIFPISQMQKYSENYIQSGGLKDFSSYYTANYHLAKFDSTLMEKMIFSTHNLVSDFSFNEFQLILCRNVLIYFERDLQSKVFKVFDYSLENFGYLALGSKESLRFSPIADRYRQVGKEKIWRKVYEAI
jgi:chemotaxis protein methyltransferase CheR